VLRHKNYFMFFFFISERILYPRDLNNPFRPAIQALESCFDCVRECIRESWAELPDDRPDFKTIRTRLRPLRKGMKPNIFDNMMAMMEKYANNLEQLVDERTDQLQEEKKKTEALLLGKLLCRSCIVINKAIHIFLLTFLTLLARLFLRYIWTTYGFHET
jgi:hypothetical protein